MAKSPQKPKPQRSVQSTTKPTTKNKAKSALPDKTCNCCEQLFAGKPSGTQVVAEDDTCYFAPPPQGTSPWLWYCDSNINNGLPYWEELANFEPAPGGGMQLKPAVREAKSAPPVPPPDETPRQELM